MPQGSFLINSLDFKSNQPFRIPGHLKELSSERLVCSLGQTFGQGAGLLLGRGQSKQGIFFPSGSPFPLELSSFGLPGVHFLSLAEFLTIYFFSPLGAMEPSLSRHPLGMLKTLTLLQRSLVAIRLCSTKGKKALSPWVLGAWTAVLWRVKRSQLASLTWMIELTSF